jgi:hypothetical protein
MLAAIALSCAPTPSLAAGRRSSSGPPRARRGTKISGPTEDGRLLSVNEGSWLGSSPITFTYQWEVCEHRRHGTCSPIAGATGTTYRATTQDVRHNLVVLVTAKNSEGTSTKRSKSSKTIKEGSPLNLAAPEISGNLLEGTKLTAGTGTWVGSAPFQFSYQWERCSILGGGCEPIEGATGVSYSPGAADLTMRLAVIVTASNIVGKASSSSPETLPVEAVLPTNILPPQILGLFKEGQLLSAEPGRWEGTEPLTYGYQWQLCNAAGEACANIKNATEPTFKLLTGHIGDTLDVVVTAENSAGSSSRTSSPTGLIAGLLPANITVPSISGGLLEGEVLKLSAGEWSGTEPISFSYAWELCDAAGRSCKEVEGAAGSTLQLLAGFIGDTVEGVVTAKNVAGEATATSSVTSLVKGIAPVLAAAPAISGGLVEGDELRASPGKWSGTEPISYSYQWQLCTAAGKSCSEMKGSTSSALALLGSYIGDTVEVVVTAKNVAGSTPATSVATELIKGIAPAYTSLPTIVGTLLEGQLLSAGTGTWSGSEPISYGYQWQLCNLLTKACSNIGGATEKAFKLGLEDVGGLLDVIVTAKNVAGSSSATSSLTSEIGL